MKQMLVYSLLFCVVGGVDETKEQRISLSFHAWSFPYVHFALLPIHHISLWARQLSGAEAYSQFSSPSNCTKYSNSSVKLEQGVEGWESKSVTEAQLGWWIFPTLTLSCTISVYNITGVMILKTTLLSSRRIISLRLQTPRQNHV